MQPTRFPAGTPLPPSSSSATRFPASGPIPSLPRATTTSHPSAALSSSAPPSSASAESLKNDSGNGGGSGRNTRGITIGGWSIQVTSGPIGSSAEMDALSDLLGIPPPEMAFPHNSLVLAHEKSGFSLCFDAVRALRCVEGVKAENRLDGIDCYDESKQLQDTTTTTTAGKRSGGKVDYKPAKRGKVGIKVAYAKEWGKKRQEQQQQQHPYPIDGALASGEGGRAVSGSESHFNVEKAVITTAKEYDWTYSTTWAGAIGATSPPDLLSENPTESKEMGNAETTEQEKRNWFEPGRDPSMDRIPVERLGASSGEPILFYDDIVLYEDELADNGSSMVNVKVRVMPSGFLVLQRFFLRVDDVVFRVFDTRIYCEFTEQPVEEKGQTVMPLPLSLPSTATAAAASNVSSSASETPSSEFSKLTLGATRNARKRTAETAAATTSSPPCVTDRDPSSDSDSVRFPRIIRECSGSEASYSEVRSQLPPYKSHDLSPLTDLNWVSSTLQLLSQRKAMVVQSAAAQGRSTFASTSATSRPPLHPTTATATASSSSSPWKYVVSQHTSGFPGARPGEIVDLSPARIEPEAAAIIGEIANDKDSINEDDLWIGIGGRVDVAVLTHL